MIFFAADTGLEYTTSKYQDQVLLEKLSNLLDEHCFDDWVNYVYKHRNTPVDKIVQDLSNEQALSKMTIDDIDETILWIKWLFNLNGKELRS